MPRAFLIKKKRHHGLSGSASAPTDAKRRKWHLELDESDKKEHSYDSGSESGCSSVSTVPTPSPTPSPNPDPPMVSAITPAYMGRPTTDLYGRSAILEPLNLNATTAASALPWMKPFLAPYLPFNFPYPHHYPSNPYSEAAYPHHFLGSSVSTPALHPHQASHRALHPQQAPRTLHSQQSPPSSHRVMHPQQVSPSSHRALHPQQAYTAPKGTQYPSRSEPPSPSCPCPLSPYTPPKDSAPASKTPLTGTVRDDHRSESSESSATAVNMTVTANYWTESERCDSSNDSVQSAVEKDYDDQLVIREEEEDCPKPVSRRRAPEGSPRYQCPDCNKSYSTYSGLSKHQQFHCSTTNKRSFSCKYCDKVYMSLGSLKMHIRCHSLPCLCPMCPKRFSRPWLLQGHIRTHTGEKPFICPECNRAFADRSNLRAHLQTHSDVKKYSCKQCGKTFSRMSLLLKHGDGGACTQSQDRLGV